MNKIILIITILAITVLKSYAQISDAHTIFNTSYIGGVLSNIPKSNAGEAINAIDAYKNNVLGCMAMNAGNESTCGNVTLQASSNFTYIFDPAPQNGSKIWGIKAVGNGQSGLNSDDYIAIQSDATGSFSCKGYGKLANTCY